MTYQEKQDEVFNKLFKLSNLGSRVAKFSHVANGTKELSEEIINIIEELYSDVYSLEDFYTEALYLEPLKY